MFTVCVWVDQKATTIVFHGDNFTQKQINEKEERKETKSYVEAYKINTIRKNDK